MASLYLIRHGQASFMQANYDQLSKIGEVQSAYLGRYLAENEHLFEACWMGSLARHKGTFEGVRGIFKEKEMPFPEAEVLTGLNEHHAAEIHYKHLPDFLEEEENASLKKTYAEFGKDHPQVKKALLRLFFQSTRLWARGELHSNGYEAFPDFKKRVTEAYEVLIQAMETKLNAIVFTSGGTIAMLMGILLELGDEKIIELNWQIKNTSITEFSYSKGKFYLRGFNHLPHLKEDKLITFV